MEAGGGGGGDVMSRPPLEAPPFAPPHVRRCIRTTVRVQNYDRPQVVFILTSMSSSVEDVLSADPQNSAPNGNDDGMNDSASDASSSSSTTSTEDDDTEDEMEEDNDGAANLRNRSSRAAAQCTGVPRSSRPGSYRMKAYLIFREPIHENPHGGFKTYIHYAKVLERVDSNWIDTGKAVAIKAISWQCVRACLSRRISEDFVKEVAALKYVSDWHGSRSMMDTHVLTADAVMSSDTHLLIVMPYCDGGNLCEHVAAQRPRQKLTEDESRFWFRQILKGLETLQQMRICHKDLSPENVTILDNKSLVIDWGMCLRIPYSAAGRHLITPKKPCGKWPHMAPEIRMKKGGFYQPFDGHAVDTWAAGTILLFMLTGQRMDTPPVIDRAFDQMDLGVSKEATDLLQKMFRLDPKDRLSLDQIKQHPFVRNYH